MLGPSLRMKKKWVYPPPPPGSNPGDTCWSAQVYRCVNKKLHYPKHNPSLLWCLNGFSIFWYLPFWYLVVRPRNILKEALALHHQKYWHIWEKNQFSLEISKFSLALQPEALVNTSGRVLFSSPGSGRKATKTSEKTRTTLNSVFDILNLIPLFTACIS